MNLVKCPRCDLNYIREDEKYCKVCLQEMKGESRSEEIELCSICNEEPCLPGKDVCLFCLREMILITERRPKTLIPPPSEIWMPSAVWMRLYPMWKRKKRTSSARLTRN